jgi:hypothetical protein
VWLGGRRRSDCFEALPRSLPAPAVALGGRGTPASCESGRILTRAQPTPAQHAQWAVRLRPAWSKDGLFLTGKLPILKSAACPPMLIDRIACTGSHVDPVLRVLDFAPSPAAACHVERSTCTALCSGCRACQGPLELRTSSTAVAVAVHPLTDDIAVGTQVREVRARCMANGLKQQPCPSGRKP